MAGGLLLLLLLPCLLPGAWARPQGAHPHIATLVSDIYNDIIRSRLKHLLEGVSPSASPAPSLSSLATSLLEGSGTIISREHEVEVEVALPESITEIPRKLFTSLPGKSSLSILQQIF
jgi:hypothetical protein